LPWLLLLAACARPTPLPLAEVAVVRGEDEGLRGEVVSGGTLTERMSPPDEAELVLLFGGETRGDLAPCGCKDRPAGGLARVGAHVAGVRDTGAPALLLDAGAFLDDTQGFDGALRPDVAAGNAWVRDGLDQLRIDAVNVTPVDLPGLREAGGAALPGVSANLQAEGVERSVVREVGGLRVGITGVSAVPPVLPPGATVLPPTRGLLPVLEDLSGRADVVVLLAWNAPEAAKVAARKGLVDVVIDAQGHTGRHAPLWVGGAVWVRSPAKTERLGELRLQIEDGRVTAAVDRRIDLGPGAPEDADLATLASLAAEDVARVRAEVFAPVVRSPR
jgi:2',3'-cyclic-nucleotide 2'-phosphodiesterase (5'-nucleotidase family)